MTPDSGCFSVCHNNSKSLTGSESLLSNSELPIDANGSYLTYIKTFAVKDTSDSQDQTDMNQNNVSKFVTKKTDLTKFNIYELNDLIEQIEANTKVLSDTLIQVGVIKFEKHLFVYL